MLSGLVQKARGCRSGLPDVAVFHRRGKHTKIIFVELKSRRGKVSDAQKQVREELLRINADWWLAFNAEAALKALRLSGIRFLRPWRMPRLAPWHGPFRDPTLPLPVAPEVVEERRDAQRRATARRRERREAARAAALGEAAHKRPRLHQPGRVSHAVPK